MNAPRSRSLAVVLLATLALALAGTAPALAAPGDLDPTFDGDGIVITDFPGSIDRGNAVAMDGSGRIVVVGTARVRASGDDFAVARYLPDGALDPAFGDDGVVVTDVTPLPTWTSAEAAAVAIDGSARIVVAGQADSNFAVIRYNTDGSLDTSFGGDGIIITDFDGQTEVGRALALDSTGRILVAGDVGRTGVGVVRYNPDGTVDTTFGDEGLATTFLPDAMSVDAYAMALDDSGRILVAPTARYPTVSSVWWLVRFTTDGILDMTFGDHGLVWTDFTPGYDTAHAIAIADSGKIVVGGQAGSSAFAIARYNSDGTQDASFDNDGKVITDIGGTHDASVAAIALDQSDRIVAVGTSGPDIAVVRYQTNGAVDASFGGGLVLLDFDNRSSAGSGVVLDAIGNVIVAGTTLPNRMSNNTDFALARCTTDGALDPLFGQDGMVVIDVTSGDDVAHDVTIDRAGRILVAGSARQALTATRYLPEGALDLSFGGGDGQAEIDGDEGPIPPWFDWQGEAAVGDRDQIVLAGVTPNWKIGSYAVAALTPDGEIDPTFAGDGLVTGWAALGEAMALDTHGRVVIGGYQAFVSDGFALLRYSPDGDQDRSFGEAGSVIVSLGGWGGARDVTFDSAERIVVAGTGGSDDNYGFALARLNADGSADMAFGHSGTVIADVGNNDSASALALDSHGRILVAGTSDKNIALLCFNPDGTLDAGFAVDGVLIADLGGNESGTGVAVDRAGRIIVAGTSSGDFVVLRVNPDGTFDPTFGGDGIVTTDLGGDDVANRMALDAFGRIVVAGATDAGGTKDLAVVRYLGDLPQHHWLPLMLR